MIIKGGAGPEEAAAIAAVIAELQSATSRPVPEHRPQQSAWVAAVRHVPSRLRSPLPSPSVGDEAVPSRFVDPIQ